jgi:dephospho-CoA kinase
MIVGLTGGIGSGKSTAGDFFYELGIDIIDADEVAKKVLDDNEKAKNLFIQNFGNEFLNKDNSINRNLLRTKILKIMIKKLC